MAQNICCVGAGLVGGVTSAIVAHKNPSIQVHVVDVNVERIDAWNSDVLPFAEPDLLDIVRAGRDGTDGKRKNLLFSTNTLQAIETADLVFIAVETPATSTKDGSVQKLNTSHVLRAVDAVARHSSKDKTIVIRSTISSGISEYVRNILIENGRPGISFHVLYNPEFFSAGTAVKNLLNPDRVIIGSKQNPEGLMAARMLANIYKSWTSAEKILLIDTPSAELSKLAANALLAQRISSINALSAVCERTGGDIEAVSLACGLDKRIGTGMLDASLGFGGSCFRKDIQDLASMCFDLSLTQIGRYWQSIVQVNELQLARFTSKITERLSGNLTTGKVAVLGCTFKNGTSDTSESPAVTMIASLVDFGFTISVCDPKVDFPKLLAALAKATDRAVSEHDWQNRLSMHSSTYDACDGAQAMVVATNCDQLLDGIDWIKTAQHMQSPRAVFDGHNVVNKTMLQSLGFEVHTVGKAGNQSILPDIIDPVDGTHFFSLSHLVWQRLKRGT